MQSRLEKEGIEERKIEIIKNDYNSTIEHQYSSKHKNATTEGGGKGTLHGGHTSYLPDSSKNKSTIDYSNFDTTNGGNKVDVEKRNEAMARSLYNKSNPYGIELINTEENQRNGQFKL